MSSDLFIVRITNNIITSCMLIKVGKNINLWGVDSFEDKLVTSLDFSTWTGSITEL